LSTNLEHRMRESGLKMASAMTYQATEQRHFLKKAHLRRNERHAGVP